MHIYTYSTYILHIYIYTVCTYYTKMLFIPTHIYIFPAIYIFLVLSVLYVYMSVFYISDRREQIACTPHTYRHTQ